IEEQVSLQSLDSVNDGGEDDADHEHGLAVALPVPLALGVGADEPIEASLDGAEQPPAEPRRSVDTCHVRAEWIRQRDQDDRVDEQLADVEPVQNRSPRNSAYTR